MSDAEARRLEEQAELQRQRLAEMRARRQSAGTRSASATSQVSAAVSTTERPVEREPSAARHSSLSGMRYSRDPSASGPMVPQAESLAVPGADSTLRPHEIAAFGGGGGGSASLNRPPRMPPLPVINEPRRSTSAPSRHDSFCATPEVADSESHFDGNEGDAARTIARLEATITALTAEQSQMRRRSQLQHVTSVETTQRHRTVLTPEQEARDELESLFRYTVVDLACQLHKKLKRAELKASTFGNQASALRTQLTSDQLAALGGTDGAREARAASGRASPTMSVATADSSEWSESQPAPQVMVAELEAVKALQENAARSRQTADEALAMLDQRDAELERAREQLGAARKASEVAEQEHRAGALAFERLEERSRAAVADLRRDQIESVSLLQREIATLVRQVSQAEAEAARCQTETQAVFLKRQEADLALAAAVKTDCEMVHGEVTAGIEKAVARERSRAEKAEARADNIAKKLLRLERANADTVASRSQAFRQLSFVLKERDEIAAEASRRVTEAQRLRGRDDLDQRRRSAELSAAVADKERTIERLREEVARHDHVLKQWQSGAAAASTGKKEPRPSAAASEAADAAGGSLAPTVLFTPPSHVRHSAAIRDADGMPTPPSALSSMRTSTVAGGTSFHPGKRGALLTSAHKSGASGEVSRPPSPPPTPGAGFSPYSPRGAWSGSGMSGLPPPPPPPESSPFVHRRRVVSPSPEASPSPKRSPARGDGRSFVNSTATTQQPAAYDQSAASAVAKVHDVFRSLSGVPAFSAAFASRIEASKVSSSFGTLDASSVRSAGEADSRLYGRGGAQPQEEDRDSRDGGRSPPHEPADHVEAAPAITLGSLPSSPRRLQSEAANRHLADALSDA